MNCIRLYSYRYRLLSMIIKLTVRCLPASSTLSTFLIFMIATRSLAVGQSLKLFYLKVEITTCLTLLDDNKTRASRQLPDATQSA